MSNEQKIKRNSAKCMLCGEEIESKHRHDFVMCKCENLFVDGGKDYLRRGARDIDKCVDTSIYEEV